MNIADYENNIGKNIKDVRSKKGLSQKKLGEKTDIANTLISAYEHDRKKPGLATVATIAKALGVSIDRLYYGDENISFINAVPDRGRQIVNSICLLWETGVIYWPPQGIINYVEEINRLINGLIEFENKKDTYDDPEGYMEMLKSSVANEINKTIERESSIEEKKKKEREELKKTPSPSQR